MPSIDDVIKQAAPMCVTMANGEECCIATKDELNDYVRETLQCFKETHNHVCNYEDAIPGWLTKWVGENPWAGPILDWKETIG